LGRLWFRVIREEAVDHVELDFGLGFARQLALEQFIAIQVEGKYLLQGLGRLDLTGDVAVGFLGGKLS